MEYHGSLVRDPGHLESFSEIVRIRREEYNIEWLSRSLCSEVEQYSSASSAMHHQASLALRKRIGVILGEMMMLGGDTLPEILKAINYSQDENLRFALWEVACLMAENEYSLKCEEQIENVSRNFSLELGELLLTVGEQIPEDKLISAMYITDDDISRAAIDRHPPAHDVKQHEQNKKKQLAIAQGFKALLLLTIASTKTEQARKFLRDYGLKIQSRDEKIAANIGLMLNGDVQAFEEIEKIAKSIDRRRNIHNIHKSLKISKDSPNPKEFVLQRKFAKYVDNLEHQSHIFSRHHPERFNSCISKSKRAAMAKDDASCVFCSKNFVLTKRIYSYQNVNICFECHEYSEMISEQRSIDYYFTSLNQNFGR